MTIQTESRRPAPGDNYTVLRGAPRRAGHVGRRRDLPVAAVDRFAATTTACTASTRTSASIARSASTASSRSRRRPASTAAQLSGKGSIVWNDNFLHTQYSLLIGRRQLPRRHRVHQADRHPQALRRLRRAAASRRRCASIGIRELHPHTRYNIYTDQSNVKVSHTDHVAMSAFLENGGNIEFAVNPRFERIVVAVRGPAGSVVCARHVRVDRVQPARRDEPQPDGVGVAGPDDGRVLDRARSGRPSSGVIVRPSYHLTFDLALQRNDIDLPFPMHPFVTNLVTSRIGYAFSTRTFLDTLLQYNTDLQAVQRQRPLRSHPPAAERSVRRLQRAAADRSAHAGQHRARADRQVHAHARVLNGIGTAIGIVAVVARVAAL